jgi:type I restriction enzyme S subunit
LAARHAVEAIRAGQLAALPLFGPDGLCPVAHNAFRFRRAYVGPEHGIPFIGSSDIIWMGEPRDRYLSHKLTKKLDRLLIQKNDVLISCSGTVGNVALAGDTLAGKALSQHAIRLRHPDPLVSGFVTAFLRGRYGRPQLTGASYGSVVTHIEPEHLAGVQIPSPSPILLARIGKPMVEAARLRDEANRLLAEADQLLLAELGLPDFATFKKKHRPKRSFMVWGSAVADRLEGSFYGTLPRAIERAVNGLECEALPLGDSQVTKEVRPITKFRKRVYVERGGIPLLSSKQLFQIDPIDVKRLAAGAHTKDLVEIALEREMIAVTCSGTIGQVQMIPEYMAGWAANQHATRIIAADDMHPGYLFAWLASEFGNALLRRQSYGSVILEIDKEMLASIPVPVLDGSKRDKIGELVRTANGKRNEAWEVEQDAIETLESLIVTPGSGARDGDGQKDGDGADADDPSRQFRELVTEWRNDTAHLSNVKKRVSHPAYQKIVDMGWPAVRLILQDLAENGPDDWFWALSKITGDNPITADIVGRMEAMTEAWLKWGIKAGELPDSRRKTNGGSRS